MKDISNWKSMFIEDKILLIMEIICYLFAIASLVTFIVAYLRRFTDGIIFMFLGMIGFIACGLTARSTRKVK